MWVFNGEAVQQFLGRVAEGFQHGPLELAEFAAMFLVLLGVPLLLGVVTTRRSRARARSAAMARFQEAAAAAGLVPEELEALIAMARRFSPDPLRWPAVLTRAAAFNAAAARGGLDAAMLARLRWKLRLIERGPRARLHSTVELEPDEVLLVTAGDAAVAGRVTSVSAERFELHVGRPVPAGTVKVRATRDSGIYDVEVPVLSSEGGILRLGHGEIASRVQNRRFLRRTVRGAALVTTASGAEVRVRLVDLSGGGARVRGPAAGVLVGDAVTLRFARPGGSTSTIASRVVRVAGDGFSLAFEDVPGPVREELIRLLGR